VVHGHLLETGDGTGSNTRQQVRLQFLSLTDEEVARQLVYVARGSVALPGTASDDNCWGLVGYSPILCLLVYENTV